MLWERERSSIPLFQHVVGLQGRWSYWHCVPLKPGKHLQLYPETFVVGFEQVPLFWQGLSVSHGWDDTLQPIPILSWVGQFDTKK